MRTRHRGLLNKQLKKSAQSRDLDRVKRKLSEANARLSRINEASAASDRLVSCLEKYSEELSAVLKRMHPLMSFGSGGGVNVIRCASCDDLIAHDIVTFHECCESMWQPFTGCIENGTCQLCKQRASPQHKCRMVSRVVIDLVGISSISNPLTPELSEASAAIMKLPGLRCSVFRRPQTEEGIKNGKCSELYMHHSIVAKSRTPEKGYAEYTVTGLDPSFIMHRCSSEFDQGSPRSPLENRAVVGLYTSLDRFRRKEGRMPDLGLSALNSLTIQGEDLPPMTSHYFCNCAHGTSSNVIVFDMPDGDAFMCAIKKSKPGEEMEWDYLAITDDPNDPALKIVCTCDGKAIHKMTLTSIMHELGLRACPKSIITFKDRL